MSKDYLAMIADIEETPSMDCEKRGKSEKRSVTPASVLAASRYGSLTRGGLRDALSFRTGCTPEDALRRIDEALEAWLIAEGEDRLLRVRQ